MTIFAQQKGSTREKAKSMCGCYFTFIFLLSFSLLLLVGTTNGQTTRHLKEIIIGRCYSKHESANCTRWWEQFSESWMGKDNANVTNMDYDVFFSQDLQDKFNVPPNRTLFWSGTRGIQTQFSHIMSHYMILEETNIGFSFDNLYWCGTSKEDEPINYKSKCPFGDMITTTSESSSLSLSLLSTTRESLSSSSSSLSPSLNINRKSSIDSTLSGLEVPNSWGAMYSFWRGASIGFASQASGTVTALLGHNLGSLAYRKNSFFGAYEVPSLDANKVTSFQILLIRSIPSEGEECGSGSLKQLHDDLEKRFQGKVPITCIDDDITVRYIICSNDPSSIYCNFVDASISERKVIGFTFSSLAIGIIVGASLSSIIFLIIFLCVKRIGRNKTLNVDPLLEGEYSKDL